MQVAPNCAYFSTCAECNSDTRCGWCGDGISGQCLAGSSAGAFYPFACPAATWQYDSCPCNDYQGADCSECLSLSPRHMNGTSERAKRQCGFCPLTQSCIETSEESLCGLLPTQIGYAGSIEECPTLQQIKDGHYDLDRVTACDAHGGGNFTICECVHGYHGANCSLVCPGGTESPCSNNGHCSPTTGECDCDDSHFGHDCSSVCPGGEDTPCSLNGVCVQKDTPSNWASRPIVFQGSCWCDLGYRGAGESVDCSAEVEVVEGCMNDTMFNYLPEAVVDVGCMPYVYGAWTSSCQSRAAGQHDDGLCNNPCRSRRMTVILTRDVHMLTRPHT